MNKYERSEARDRKTSHRMRLTFQSGRCKSTFKVDMEGNCAGFENLPRAIDGVYEWLPRDEDDQRYFEMHDPENMGKTVRVYGPDDGPIHRGTLMDMLVGAEIVGLVVNGKLIE